MAPTSTTRKRAYGARARRLARASVTDANGNEATDASERAIACAAMDGLGRVFRFGGGRAEGARDAKARLGGKGANLAEMSRVGLSVPPGFTVDTETCADFHANGGALPEGAWEEMVAGLAHVEAALGKTLGDAENPLLVSVRSGAAVSMPGMMDTVLNLGLNDSVVEGLARRAGGRFAFDSYRRFLDMYGNVVMGIDHGKFEHALETLKRDVGVDSDEGLNEQNLRDLVEIYKGVYA